MIKRRLLSIEERKLWRQVTQSVRRLTLPTDAETESPSKKPDKGARTSGALLKSANAQKRSPAIGHSRPQPVLEAGDPRMARHVRRGRREIDATIDLHGLTQEEAYTALQKFLILARTKGHRVLLVITGKGTRVTEDETGSYSVSRGILRQRFLQWAEGPFREHIASVKPSHQRHGGAGAFYVFLKRV